MYRLSVHQIQQSCLFELTWGQGQRLAASLAYPAQLTTLYQTWRRAYLSYYRQALRGRAAAAGQAVSPQVDWHSQVVQAEARLLSEFHKWLRHEALFELRATLVKGQKTLSGKMELFLTCTPLEIARLPWETWEMGADLGQQGQIQILRSPPTIHSATRARQQFRRGRARVLAILGDEQGLDFAGDRQALEAQRQQLDLHYVGWQPNEDAAALKQRICQAIADPTGWDVLFFAGHSNEERLLAGQIAIAPHTSISVKELSPYLRQAQQQGLQFALFNSCSGLDIASGLISLGLSQVAIMREPVHNAVAHSFLRQFLRHLARYEDVETALNSACRFLKLEQAITYPSAYLVPSLFRHPDSRPYQIQPTGWRQRLRQLRPKRPELVAVGVLALLSLMPPINNWLLDQRVLTQAIYRNLTGQLADSPATPIVLVQIDQPTFAQQGIDTYKPIDRGLLADIVNRLTDLDAPVIGIDYLLDLPQAENDTKLNQALQRAIAQNQSWLVFITAKNPGGDWIEVYPKVAQPEWILRGDAWVPLWHIAPLRSSRRYQPPFSYQLATAYRLSQATRSGDPNLPQPSLEGPFLQYQLQAFLDQTDGADLSPRASLHPLTQFSYRFRQRWLQPLIDFSLPPGQVYAAVTAGQLLESPAAARQSLNRETLANSVVIVAAGGYYAAGIARDGEDNLPLPPAIDYWFDRSDRDRSNFTGGEAHAYMTHHLLRDRLVLPIPDLWMILAAALVGKVLVVYLSDRRRLSPLRVYLYLVAFTAGYGLFSLQLYLSGAILLPWLFPTLTVWLYFVLSVRENHRERT
ncbi:CHASE2 domain-containing protein [Nodosilinea sp. LEGE 07088]|nr:CHASE2 domain-containing protein [Nodosilinea sp. LEGE 07088]